MEDVKGDTARNPRKLWFGPVTTKDSECLRATRGGDEQKGMLMKWNAEVI